MDMLHGRRELRLHSGLLSDAAVRLLDSGALAAGFRHTATALVGTRALYDWAATHEDFQLLGCDQTHSLQTLASLKRFVAVNTALEVDLFGQCNLEVAVKHAVSGAGGAPDFARAAKVSAGGLSIVALPATAGKHSRVVAQLGNNAVASLQRTDVDVIVTEHGEADLRGRSVHERAERIIQIAAPQFREDLTAQWKAMAAEL
jgi:acyl-CoA hydrolase